ncbi:MAG TPA: MmgE/PrpD family protein [Bradyrhizobium sp.]|uniref:MmgE/PrpD family protein n=1 Tax=Bradyrhizobium sp. TaxID=376 RepID=UPI002D7ECC7D|nr:MmgE/PrpD family protein [Bradyrhizobium sp.]HET7886903.1 MmgE/PrpD family protein [Bradyrhizobium sp.]
MAEETATLAAYVANLRFEDIPQEVRERAKALTLDFLGSAIRARRDAESTPSLFKTLEALALDSSGESTVFGDSRTFTPAIAALLNGALGHSLDFDDTHADSSLHPSAPVVPAAFAIGELVGASGREVLTAIVAGYEVCCRIGNALDPTSHYARGFHPTATAGTYGAAAAASKLFGLSRDQIIAAFGVAGSQAAGSLQFLVNGAWNKRYQVGASAMNGVIAATLARNDFVGATQSIEGKHGLLVGYSDNPHPEKAVADLGKVYETMKIGVKPYPSCRYTHAALDALIALRREHNLTPDQIKRVEIGLHRNGITLAGDPATKRHPKSVVGGQFSMFFTGAVALDQGRFGWDDYARLGDAAVDALADKFDVVQDSRLEGRTHPFGARVSITTEDGVHERIHDDPSGEPTTFPDASAMAQKFLTLARPVLNGRADQLADAILSLERFDRVAQATQLGRQ